MAISSYSAATALSILSSYSGYTPTKSSTSSTSTPKTTNITKLTPWDSSVVKADTVKTATKTLNSPSLFSGGLGSGAGSGVKSSNDHELFLLYNAVDKLKALADYATSSTMTDKMREKVQKRIEDGLAEIDAQCRKNGLDGATLISGKKYSSLKTDKLGSTLTTYTTDVLANGDENTVPSQFLGNVKFSVSVTEDNVTKSVDVDLSGMGSTERTVGNVANYINEQLSTIGVETRFSRVETTKASTVKGVADTKQQSFKVTVGNGEHVTFGPASNDSETAIYVAGAATYNKSTSTTTTTTKTTTSTADEVVQSVLSRIDLASDGSTEKVSSTAFTATKGLNLKAMTKDADGNIYVVANIDGTYTNANNLEFVAKDTNDVVLQKIDTAGNVVWSRSLGSEASATGYSIAVSNDGTVAIAGSVNGLGDTQKSTTGNGTDSFVSTFDADGKDLWYYQKGAYGTDQALDLKFDDSGNLLVLGKTSMAYGGADTNGGTDVYVQSFDNIGAVNYTKTIGTSGNDVPVGIEVNGSQAYVAWNTETEGHISRLDTATGNFAAADYLTSSNGIATISGLEIDASGNAIVAGNTALGNVNDQIRGINLLTGATTFSEDLAGSPVRNFSVDGNLVNVALEGTTDELAKDTTARQTLLKGFALNDGSQVYSVAALGEANSNVTVISTQNQSKSLQALGLPQGELNFDNTKSLTDLTGLRAGDYFYLSVNGKTDRKITIDNGETLVSLQDKIKKYLGSNGTTSVSGSNGNKYLSISAKNTSTIELKAGSAKADALAQLGLSEGFITNGSTASTTAVTTGTNNVPVVALELPSEVDTSDKASSTLVASQLSSVLSRIRSAYRAISDDPDMVAARKQSKAAAKSSKTGSSAAVAAYNAQAAQYAAALAKLSA